MTYIQQEWQPSLEQSTQKILISSWSWTTQAGLVFLRKFAMVLIVGARTKPSKGSSDLTMKTAYVISTVAITTNIIPLGTKYNSYIIPTTYVQSIAATDNTCSVGRTRRRRLRKRCRCRHSKKFFGMSCIGEGRLAELDK